MRGNLNPISHVERAALRNPHGDCLVDGVSGEVLDYAEVCRRSRRIAAALRRRPEVRRVGILSPNAVPAFLAQLGCYRAGVLVVPGNARYATADNAAIFSRFEVDLVFLHPSLWDDIAELAADMPDGAEFVNLGDALADGTPSFAEWCGEEEWEGVEIADPDAPYMIQPTGGTTGLPKGVLLPVREAMFCADSFRVLAPFDGAPVFLAAVPLTHAAGKLTHYIFALGGSVVVLPGATPGEVVPAIARWRVTHTFLPPTVIYGVLDSGLVGEHDLSSLKYLFYGGAPMSPARLAQAIAALGPVLAQIYGQTESGLPNCYLAPEDHLGADGSLADEARLASAGRINPACAVALLSPEGRQVAEGEIGEIAVRGEGVMLGYIGDEEATAATRHDGWHLTGDMAFLDPDGFVHIVDRAKDMIISGGFNIYPAEIERVVNAHPGVGECAVIGVPDERWGEAVAAVIERKAGESVLAEDVIALCKERLGSLKAPKQVFFSDALPRSPVGKVLKREVRDQFWKGKGRQV